MWKIFFLSGIIAAIAVPARMARTKNPKLGLKRALVYMSVFYCVFYFTLVFIYGRF